MPIEYGHDMGLIVQKFGGTSVADITRIKKIVDIVKFELAQNNQLIIIVSAMAGVTNHLITLWNELSSLNSSSKMQEYDAALSSGELVIASLLTLYLLEENIKACSFAAWQLLILTNDYSNALVESFDTALLELCLNKNIIPVIAGFQGVTFDNRVTLGRGGSDTSAALTAAAACADRCDIYTDVEGVFTADPRIVHHAKKLKQISYELMLEFASSRAKVLNPRCIEVAMCYNIPLRVLSSFSLMAGTIITLKNEIMENKITTGVTSYKNLLKVLIENTSLNFNQLCMLAAEYNIHIKFMLTLTDSSTYSFVTTLADRNKIEVLLEELKFKGQLENFSLLADIAIVTIIGYGIKMDLKLISIIAEKLEKAEIIVEMMQTSEIKLSILIKDKHTKKAVSILHELIQ